jgi:hypothetical protein
LFGTPVFAVERLKVVTRGDAAADVNLADCEDKRWNMVENKNKPTEEYVEDEIKKTVERLLRKMRAREFMKKILTVLTLFIFGTSAFMLIIKRKFRRCR